MASAWGKAWGAAFGNAWGAIQTITFKPAGSANKKPLLKYRPSYAAPALHWDDLEEEEALILCRAI